MFCPSCGTAVADENKVCPNCGTILNVQQQNPEFQQANGFDYNPEVVVSPKKVTFGEAIKLFFVNYANFKGRATIAEYWYVFLFNVIIGTVVSLIPSVGTTVSYIYALATLIPGLAIAVRRLHDTGKSWTYLFMSLIPFAGFIILIVQLCKKSDGDNNWGPAAK